MTWEMRLATALPIPPWAAGALLTLMLLLAYLGLRLLAGLPFWEPDGAGGVDLTTGSRVSIVTILLIGYIFAANPYVTIATARDLQELGYADPSLDLASRDPRVIGLPVDQVRRSRVGGVAGLFAGIAVLMLLGTLAVGDPLLFAGRGDLADTLFSLLALLFFWLIGRAAWFTLRGSPANPGEAVSRLEVDLLDLRPFHVIGRMSLRFALLWIVGTSIGSLLFLTPGITLGLSAPLIGIMIPTLCIAAAALLLPARGVQRRIAAAKRAELERINAELRRVRDAALEGDERSQDRLAGLLSYRSYVADVREWPFDTSTFLRFALYLLIPLGSWFGSAVAERMLGAMID